MRVLNTNHKSPVNLDDKEAPLTPSAATPSAATRTSTPAPETPANPADVRLKEFATRSGATGKQGGDKTKLIMLGGGVLIALLFLVFAQFGSKTKKTAPQTQKTAETQKQTTQPQQPASHVPIMDPVHLNQQDQGGDRVNANDIERTRKPSYGGDSNTTGSARTNNPPHPPAAPAKNLGSVPPFKETQQQWENPAPYEGGNAGNPVTAQQAGNALKEASLVYVRSPQQSSGSSTNEGGNTDAPVLQLQEGTRISARLDTQISTAIHAPVVAVVEYTYAIGDQVIVPAGARVYGKLTQADSSGVVGVDFDQIELLDGAREKITAIGEGLDLGPIKGDVYGRHNGRNFLVRAMSGLGSTVAMLVGNNVNGAYSESDMIRQRASENIGLAGDSELLTLNANAHITVSVPANTRIYIVWTTQQKPTPGKPATQEAVATPVSTPPQ